MNFALLLPLALGALAALVVPLLIHLARREQQQPTLFAALRWLRERPKPHRRIRVDERWLLLVRLLLLALLAVWLARPVLVGAEDTTSWTLVAPGVDESARDAVLGTEGEQRWLATGYPTLDTPMPVAPQPTASLLRQLDAELPAAATLRVVVPERLGGLDGAALRLSRAVEWRVVAGASPVATPAGKAPVALVVRHDAAASDAVRYLRAATLALWPDLPPTSLFDAAPVDTPWPADATRIAWLAEGPAPPPLLQWIAGGGEALLSSSMEIDTAGEWLAMWRDDDGSVLVEALRLGKGRVLRFTRPLKPADMPQLLSPAFPERLAALFDLPHAPTVGFATAHAPLVGAAAAAQPPRDLGPWFALLIALLVLIERFLATSARREVRA